MSKDKLTEYRSKRNTSASGEPAGRADTRQVAVGAGVPHDDRALAVALGDPALEVGVVQRVVLGAHREPLVPRVEDFA